MKNTKQTKCITFSIELTVRQFDKLLEKDILLLKEKLESDVLKKIADRVENPFTEVLQIEDGEDYSPF